MEKSGDDDAASLSSRGSFFRRRKRNKKAPKMMATSLINDSSTTINKGDGATVNNNMTESNISTIIATSTEEQVTSSSASSRKGRNDVNDDDDASVSSKSSFFRHRRNRHSSKGVSTAPPSPHTLTLDTARTQSNGHQGHNDPRSENEGPMIISSQSRSGSQKEDVDDNASVSSKGSIFRRRKFGRKSSKSPSAAPPLESNNNPHLDKTNSDTQSGFNQQSSNEERLESVNSLPGILPASSNEEGQTDNASVSSKGSFFGRRRNRRKQDAPSSPSEILATTRQPAAVESPGMLHEGTDSSPGTLTESIGDGDDSSVRSKGSIFRRMKNRNKAKGQNQPSSLSPSKLQEAEERFVSSTDDGDDTSVSSKGSIFRRMKHNRKKAKGQKQSSSIHSESQETGVASPQDSFLPASPIVNHIPKDVNSVVSSVADDSSSRSGNSRGIFRHRRSRSSGSSTQTDSSIKLTTSASSRMSQRKSRKGPLRKFMNRRKHRDSQKALKGTRSFEIVGDGGQRNDPSVDQFDVQSLPARVNSFESDCSSLDSRSIDSRNISLYSYGEDAVSVCSLPIVVEVAEEITPKSGASNNIFSTTAKQGDTVTERTKTNSNVEADVNDMPCEIIVGGNKLNDIAEAPKDVFVISNMKAFQSDEPLQGTDEKSNRSPTKEKGIEVEALSEIPGDELELPEEQCFELAKDNSLNLSGHECKSSSARKNSTGDVPPCDTGREQPSDEGSAEDRNRCNHQTTSTDDGRLNETNLEHEKRVERSDNIIHEKNTTHLNERHAPLEETADLSSDEENGPVGLNIIGHTSVEADPLSPILVEVVEEEFIQTEKDDIPMVPQNDVQKDTTQYDDTNVASKIEQGTEISEEYVEEKLEALKYLGLRNASSEGDSFEEFERPASCLLTAGAGTNKQETEDAPEIRIGGPESQIDIQDSVDGDGERKSGEQDSKMAIEASCEDDHDRKCNDWKFSSLDPDPVEHAERVVGERNSAEAGMLVQISDMLADSDGLVDERKFNEEHILHAAKVSSSLDQEITKSEMPKKGSASPKCEPVENHEASTAELETDCNSLASSAEVPFDENDQPEGKKAGRAIKRFFSRSRKNSKFKDASELQEQKNQIADTKGPSIKPRIGSVKKWLGRRKELRRKVKDIQKNQARSLPSSNRSLDSDSAYGSESDGDSHIFSYDFDDTSTIMSTASLPPIYEVVSSEESDDKPVKDSPTMRSPSNQMKIRKSTIDSILSRGPSVGSGEKTTKSMSEDEKENTFIPREMIEPDISHSDKKLAPAPFFLQRGATLTSEKSSSRVEGNGVDKLAGQRQLTSRLVLIANTLALVQLVCYGALLWIVVMGKNDKMFDTTESLNLTNESSLENMESMTGAVSKDFSTTSLTISDAPELQTNDISTQIDDATFSFETEFNCHDNVDVNPVVNHDPVLDRNIDEYPIESEPKFDPADLYNDSTVAEEIHIHDSSNHDTEVGNIGDLGSTEDVPSIFDMVDICDNDGIQSWDRLSSETNDGLQEPTEERMVLDVDQCCSQNVEKDSHVQWGSVRRFLASKLLDNPIKVLGNMRASWRGLKSKFSLRKYRRGREEASSFTERKNIM